MYSRIGVKYSDTQKECLRSEFSVGLRLRYILCSRIGVKYNIVELGLNV